MGVVIFNHSPREEFRVLRGQRVAQLVLESYIDARLLEIPEDSTLIHSGTRGCGGFGSSGSTEIFSDPRSDLQDQIFGESPDQENSTLESVTTALKRLKRSSAQALKLGSVMSTFLEPDVVERELDLISTELTKFISRSTVDNSNTE